MRIRSAKSFARPTARRQGAPSAATSNTAAADCSAAPAPSPSPDAQAPTSDAAATDGSVASRIRAGNTMARPAARHQDASPAPSATSSTAAADGSATAAPSSSPDAQAPISDTAAAGHGSVASPSRIRAGNTMARPAARHQDAPPAPSATSSVARRHGWPPTPSAPPPPSATPNVAASATSGASPSRIRARGNTVASVALRHGWPPTPSSTSSGAAADDSTASAPLPRPPPVRTPTTGPALERSASIVIEAGSPKATEALVPSVPFGRLLNGWEQISAGQRNSRDSMVYRF